MARFEEILNEKFGFVKNLPAISMPTPARMHDDVTDRNGRGSATPGGHPMEKYREHIKAILHAVDTEDQSILERAVDWVALKRLANKHGLKTTFVDAVDAIKGEFDKKKPDYDVVKGKWEEIKGVVPYWFLGMVGRDVTKDGKSRDLPEDDKKALVNLRDIMEKISEVSGKEFERAAKNTPKGDKKTAAEKALDKAKKK